MRDIQHAALGRVDEDLARGKTDMADQLLGDLDPTYMETREIIEWLRVTAPAKDKLPNRAKFHLKALVFAQRTGRDEVRGLLEGID